MEAFNLLKEACWNKKLVSFAELQIGEYGVTEFSLVQTRFGATIKVDLGDRYVYLPNRFAKDMTVERIAALNTLSQTLIYSGRDPTRHNL